MGYCVRVCVWYTECTYGNKCRTGTRGASHNGSPHLRTGYHDWQWEPPSFSIALFAQLPVAIPLPAHRIWRVTVSSYSTLVPSIYQPLIWCALSDRTQKRIPRNTPPPLWIGPVRDEILSSAWSILWLIPYPPQTYPRILRRIKINWVDSKTD